MAVAQKGINCVTSNFLGQTFTADQVRIKFRKIEGETPKVRICSMIGPWHFVGFKHVQALYRGLQQDYHKQKSQRSYSQRLNSHQGLMHGCTPISSSKNDPYHPSDHNIHI